MTLTWTHHASDGPARAGTLHTAHGEVPTPVFMPSSDRRLMFFWMRARIDVAR